MIAYRERERQILNCRYKNIDLLVELIIDSVTHLDILVVEVEVEPTVVEELPALVEIVSAIGVVATSWMVVSDLKKTSKIKCKE